MVSVRRPIKSNNGFTLVEMVIAVAFLAIISIVLLQLFINAKNLGLKAHDLDQGVQISKSAIETIKASKDPAELANTKFFSGSFVSESADSTTIKLYFDREWKALDKSDKDLSNRSAFLATVEIKPAETVRTDMGKSGLYEINVRVEKIKPYALDKTIEGEGEIYGISAEKYFSME